MRSRHGATAMPSRDPECGKSAIAANNQRQSRQQHAASQRGIWRRIPAGMTEEGLGAGPAAQKKKLKKKNNHAAICFGFSPSLRSCPAPLGFRVKPWVLQAGARRELGMGSAALRAPGTATALLAPLHLGQEPDTSTRLRWWSGSALLPPGKHQGPRAINAPSARSHPRGSAPALCWLALPRLFSPETTTKHPFTSGTGGALGTGTCPVCPSSRSGGTPEPWCHWPAEHVPEGL